MNPQSAAVVLDENTLVKPRFWNTHPPVGLFSQVSLGGQNAMRFPQSGRTYLVTVSWDSAQGQFSPFGPLSQRPSASQTSAWVREDSRTSATQITWEVYVPTQAIYGAVSMNVSAVAFGLWSNPANLSPVCQWQSPVLIP